MNSPVIVVDDDNRATKIKAFLESCSVDVFTAENLYELMGKIYKHNIKTLIFNPHLVWVNVIEFIVELEKRKELKEYKIFFLCDNIDKEIKEKAKELNITCLDYPANMNKIINYRKRLNLKPYKKSASFSNNRFYRNISFMLHNNFFGCSESYSRAF